MSGQGNFLTRLDKALSERKLPPYQILVPAVGMRVEPGKLTIGRFDGVFIYRMTPASAYNMLRANKFKALPRIEFLESFPISSIKSVDIFIAHYLNRFDKKIKAISDANVYQSLLSKRAHAYVHGEDPPGTRVRVIPNGVPRDLFRPHPTTRKNRAGGRVELAITAHFRLGKRLRDAIVVVNLMRKRQTDLCLHVIGDLDILTRESISNIDLSACIFHGKIQSEKLPEIYARVDLGLSISLFDSCPNSVIEMLACGVPVLTSEASGAAELVPDERFIVPEELSIKFTDFHNPKRVPRIDHSLWAKYIDMAIQENRLLSELSAEHARVNFDINVIASKYADLITESWDEKTNHFGGHVRS